ncbi:zinc transporter ZIP1-like [Sycon ciliatum]|uniref:zinc transporter ZIP1-like n=1 Tax=Sycon ciliatum TaxID=27933 RepID=UPI0031F5F3C0
MNVVIVKVVCIVGLFFLTIFFTALPIRLTSWSTGGGRWRRASTSLASCLSGGIFLGVALLHLIPDVREMFDFVLCEKDLDIDYPLTELTVAGGFLLILVFEQLVLLFHQRRSTSECKVANIPPHGCDREINNCDNCLEENEQDLKRATLTSTCVPPTCNNGQHPESRNDCEAAIRPSTNGTPYTDLSRSTSTSTPEDNPAGKAATETLGSLVLLAALSLHTLFEGLALGLQSDTDGVIEIFIAILLHKCVLAFALGIRMVKLKATTRRILLAALLFAGMSPIGGAIGIAVEANATNEVDRQLVTACLQGIATGTFLFVTFLEIISPEIQGKHSPGESDIHVMRLALIVFGFAIIALVSLHHEPHHGHAGEECGHGHGLLNMALNQTGLMDDHDMDHSHDDHHDDHHE